MGIVKRTLVWYCSDNGGLPDDPDSVGRLRGHEGSLWEGGVRVPGIVEWPGHPDGARMMRAEAERVLASVEARAAGQDYPIQPRGAAGCE